MSTKATPEKVRSLLSSFLASSSQHSPPKSGETSTSPPKSKRKITEDTNKDDSSNGSSIPAPSQTSALTPKSKTSSNLRSLESFLERLDTFSPLTWFGKPTELSPLICARYGWINVDTDSLQCVSCKAHLYGKLPDPSDNQAYKKFKEKLLTDILAAHNKFCVLAANPCLESFCTLSCDDPSSLIAGFSNRVKALERISSSLPSLDFSTLHSYSYDEGQGAAYCKRVILPDCDISPQVVALSVTGWSCLPLKKDILSCDKCRRQVGLWNYERESAHSSYTTENENGNEQEEPSAKIPKIQLKSFFNPIEEHKHWCPWIQSIQFPSSSSPSKSLSVLNTEISPSGKASRKDGGGNPQSPPAFIEALKVMAPGLIDNNTGLAQTMKVSPMADGLRCFRRVMKTWSSPKSTTATAASITATPAAPSL